MYLANIKELNLYGCPQRQASTVILFYRPGSSVIGGGTCPNHTTKNKLEQPSSRVLFLAITICFLYMSILITSLATQCSNEIDLKSTLIQFF